jgi:transposase InsO family protein
MVRLLKVSRSGYYVWLDRKPSERMIRRENVEQKVAWLHGDSDEVYGSPRILADLRADGETISRKTVAKTMQRLGLVGIFPKKWWTTTIIDHADAYPVDAVKRKWDTGALNQVWVGDVILSCGEVGVCWDNAVAESFFTTLKNEMYYQTNCDTRADARTVIVDYVETYYDRKRLHSTLDYLTSLEAHRAAHRAQAAETLAA